MAQKKRPFYHLIATDSRNPRDGRYNERLGYFNPIARGAEVRLEIKRERIAAWVLKGAQLSHRVKALVMEWDKKAAA